MKVTQPYSVVSTNGTAQIHCTIHPRTSTPHVDTNRHLTNSFIDVEDMQVTLLRGLHGSQKICSSTLTISEQQEIQPEKDGDVRLQIDLLFGFLLFDVNVMIHDLILILAKVSNEVVRHYKSGADWIRKFFFYVNSKEIPLKASKCKFA